MHGTIETYIMNYSLPLGPMPPVWNESVAGNQHNLENFERVTAHSSLTWRSVEGESISDSVAVRCSDVYDNTLLLS